MPKTEWREIESTPVRVQLKRTKGWRMPPNTVKVDGSTRFGNPFGWQTPQLPDHAGRRHAVEWFRELVVDNRIPSCFRSQREELLAKRARARLVAALPEIRGKNLACWCPLDGPCHADVLLELANPTTPGDPA